MRKSMEQSQIEQARQTRFLIEKRALDSFVNIRYQSLLVLKMLGQVLMFLNRGPGGLLRFEYLNPMCRQSKAIALTTLVWLLALRGQLPHSATP